MMSEGLLWKQPSLQTEVPLTLVYFFFGLFLLWFSDQPCEEPWTLGSQMLGSLNPNMAPTSPAAVSKMELVA